ncbi:short chain dehydrogenase [Hirsutella rhossiliensis]|uniref:Short chain dehydrogenase domain-containing protein n=1 Tax=Hirsutella rhossiliensis TaxID=111463 RepID=A0A9P8N4R6_9HYPO|nr:short chain dehydrogenase domain-containing protein [Hirsutella rhossiliensis]KAH0966835.1 short chain dehydrogenase domain-containing protein [Hirsutella rhossiliensis]
MDITGYALVTGGASGIGRACCLAFAKDGARGILVADLNLEGAQQTAAEAKDVATNPKFRAEAIHANVSNEESVKAAIDHAIKSFGRIDYGVHSAGISGGTFDPIAEASFVDFKHLIDVNVNGTFLFNSLLSAAMKVQEPRQVGDPARGTTRGSIVNLASVSSFMAVPNMVQYTTCKHAIIGLTKTAGEHLETLHFGLGSH